MNQSFMLLPQKQNSHKGNRTFRGSFVFYHRFFLSFSRAFFT